MAEPRKFYRLTSAGRSLWATRATMPLPPEYSRILGLVDYAGHVEVISSQLSKYRRETVHEWLTEFEAAGLIESISGTQVALASLARDTAPPPIPPEDLPGSSQETAYADISLSRLGVYIGHDRVANRPPSTKPPSQTLAFVVEDDPDQRVLAARRLKSAGYRATAVDCVEALYAALERQAPDAIFLDVNLPDGDGFSVLATLRLHPSFTYLPVILVTARTGSADIRKGLALGADGYVTKPYGPNTLDYILRYVLRQELDHSVSAAA